MTIAGFVVAGIMLLLKRKEWRTTAIIASFISLISYLFMWDGLAPDPMTWIMGPIVSGLIIIALLIFKWPKDEVMFVCKDNQTVFGD